MAFANFNSVRSFKFHEAFDFEDETRNGLYFNGICVPEEIVQIILGYIEPKHILRATLVCKKWCNLIKSTSFWTAQYKKKYQNKSSKKLPWYVYYCFFTTDYFDQNLIKNGNGDVAYYNWEIVKTGGDGFSTEDPPSGVAPLPLEVPELNGKTSCFDATFGRFLKMQNISFEKSRLMQLILIKYKPHIYLSEWIAKTFGTICFHKLSCNLYGYKNESFTGTPYYGWSWPPKAIFEMLPGTDYETKSLLLATQSRIENLQEFEYSKWYKVEVLVKDYPEGVTKVFFEHEAQDLKTTGAVLKILFDTIA